MVPYRGRLALRIARLVVSVVCAAWILLWGGIGTNTVTAVIAAHAIYSVLELIGFGFETPGRAVAALIVDLAFFGFWAWSDPGLLAPLTCAYALTSATLLHDRLRSAVAIGAALVLAAIFDSSALPSVAALAIFAASIAFYKHYLEGRMSTTLRHNVVIRSQAQTAREAERQRIAADFHDGPLQNFVGFQLRLEIIRRQMERDMSVAKDELLQLQELCKSQVADLRAFVRSMRPPDEGMSLAASLVRVAEGLHRDTGIACTFTGEELQDPPEVDVALEILQIVREAFNNIQKHSGATRVSLSAHRRGRNVEIVVDDNGSGFSFAGSFNLEELEAARLGPVSIKRRIKMLAGEMAIESRPGEGAKLTFRVPF